MERGKYTPRIRFGYDAIRDMNLKSSSRESNEVRSDGCLNLIKLEHKVSLFPFGGRLDSPFETSPSISESSDTEGCRKAEHQQESKLPIQSDDEPR